MNIYDRMYNYASHRMNREQFMVVGTIYYYLRVRFLGFFCENIFFMGSVIFYVLVFAQFSDIFSFDKCFYLLTTSGKASFSPPIMI